MTAICPGDDIKENVLGESGDVGSSHIPLARRAAPGFRRGKSGRGQMSTIEVHEPEVKELQIKPSTRAAAVLPRADLVMGSALPPRAMFSDSLLEFGVQRKRRFFATTTSFVLNCLVIVTMLALPLMFTEELPKSQL